MLYEQTDDIDDSSIPQTETDLLARCRLIEGLSLSQLASQLDLLIPTDPIKRKGWIGKSVELALGASASSRALPDFYNLGIELKTIPINSSGLPAESTFITTIPLLSVHKQTWKTSTCYQKLKRVLWLPFEDSDEIPFIHRRIGQAILWSPSEEEELVLARDWQELSLMISTGRLAEIDATLGEWLQVRPKAATSRSLCFGFDEKGNKIQTIPRGFYLRTLFTRRIVQV